jgi:hypothetical protein
MSIDQRLTRLAPALTAQERAILILEAWKDGRAEDPAWRRSMPREQANAFNRYIELMNQANVVLGKVTGVLEMQTQMLRLRQAWLVDVTLWLEHVEEIQRAVRRAVREPITESEHQALVEAARNEWVPVEELAAFLAGYHDFVDDDYDVDEDGFRGVKDEVWDPAVAEEDKRLRALVAQGVLQARGKGKAMKLQQGALSHFGYEVGAACEDYVSYRVLPDDQAEQVEVERNLLRGLQRVVGWQQFDGPDQDELTGIPEKIRQGLRESTAYKLITTWVLVRSVEILLDEIGEEFNGIDPLRPYFREKLDATRESLLEVKEHLTLLNMNVGLREPLDEEMEEARGWLVPQ